MNKPDSNRPELASEIKELKRLVSSRDLKNAAERIDQIEDLHAEDCFSDPEFMLHKATLLNQTGDYRGAADAAGEAYDIVRTSSDHSMLVNIQTELARAHQYLGDTERAEREYRDVAASFRRIGDIEGVIDTLNRIAGIRYLRADYVEARRLLDEAWNYAEEIGDESRLARISGNAGRIAIREGRFHEAVERLSVSVEKHGKLGNGVSMSRAFLSLALVEIRLGNYDSARRNLRNSLSIVREHDLKRELAVYFEYKAELQLALGNLDDALNTVNSAIEVGHSISADGDLVSQSKRLKAEILFAMRRFDEAEESARQALNIAERIDEKLEIAQSTKVLALVADRRGASTDSKQLIEYAIALFKELNTTFELGDCYERASQLSWVDSGNRVYHKILATELFAEIGLEIELTRSPQEAKSAPSNRHVYASTDAYGNTAQIVTASKHMRSILKVVDHCKDSDIPILITGETGTGKDLLARYIHNASNRCTGKFVSVNCSAIPAELAESELFGHVKGAFTNAVEDKAGLIEAADGGTLFLNEIGELPVPLQVKLLGCLEEKRIVRVGATTSRPVDFRLISATNRDLEENIETGHFRRDLYFRIAVMTLELPPLRERRDDLIALLRHFVVENGIPLDNSNGEFSSEITANILKYRWPGNVRELRNEIQLLALESDSDLTTLLSRLSDKLREPNVGPRAEIPSGLVGQLAAFERERIREALRDSGGVIRKAADILKIPEATLRSKMKRLEI